jgi:DNA-binding transcriptional LysR family regulator
LQDVHVDGPIRRRYDLVLGVVADLELSVGDRVLYEEQMVPVAPSSHSL